MRLISVFTAAGLLEADMLKAFLEAQGLQVVLSQESVGRTLGLSAGMLGKVEVLVPEAQVADAKRLIDEIEEGEFYNTEYYDNPDIPSSDNPDP